MLHACVFFNGAQCLHLIDANLIQRLKLGCCDSLDASAIDPPKSAFRR
jgi:hypothetical protein